MPGSRDGHFRRGDLCEGIGLELLRSFALVAPVPRTEDVGSDAVITLIRRNGRRLLAEDSFWVQVKASSKRTIKYAGEKLDWLRALKLPFFLLSVDLHNAKLELRSIANASAEGNFLDCPAVTLCLGKSRVSRNSETKKVWLGEPILQWTFAQAHGDFAVTAAEVLKEWVKLEMEGIAKRKVGTLQRVTWQTNCKPSLVDSQITVHYPRQLSERVRIVRPHIEFLQVVQMAHYRENRELGAALSTVMKFLRECGKGDRTGV